MHGPCRYRCPESEFPGNGSKSAGKAHAYQYSLGCQRPALLRRNTRHIHEERQQGSHRISHRYREYGARLGALGTEGEHAHDSPHCGAGEFSSREYQVSVNHGHAMYNIEIQKDKETVNTQINHCNRNPKGCRIIRFIPVAAPQLPVVLNAVLVHYVSCQKTAQEYDDKKYIHGHPFTIPQVCVNRHLNSRRLKHGAEQEECQQPGRRTGAV